MYVAYLRIHYSIKYHKYEKVLVLLKEKKISELLRNV